MSVKKDTILYIFGSLMSKAAPFLLLPYLTRNLGSSDFGQLAILNSYIAIAVVFIGYVQQDAITRYFYFYGRRSLPNLIISSFSLSIGLSLFAILYSGMYDNYVVLIIVLSALSQQIFTSMLTIKQCEKKAKEYVFYQSLFYLLSTILTVFLFEKYGANTYLRIYTIAIIYFLIGVFLFLFFMRGFKIKQIKRLKRLYITNVFYLVSFCWPLIFHHLAIFTKGQLDKIYLSSYYSKDEIGIYAAAFQVSFIYSVLLMAIVRALLPYYYQGLKDGSVTKNRIKKELFKFMWLFFVPFFISLYIPSDVYVLFLGAEYSKIGVLVSIFLLGFSFTGIYLVLVNYLFFYGKTKVVALSNILSAIIYLICLIVFSQYSLEVAATAIVISNVFLVIIIFVFFQKLDIKVDCK